ncbi:MAG: GTP-binding protein [Desulfobacterales bacterium]|nr:GTP-binding protein [Desulfobacterales bacterium]
MIQKKICMVGSFAVGKTSLVSRFVTSLFSEKYLTTVGVKIDKKDITVGARDMRLMLWDLAGRDEFQDLTASYLRGTSGYLLVADGTRSNTIEAATELQQEVEAVLGDVPFILVVNKYDLIDKWVIGESDVEHFRSKGWDVILTSAKQGHAVEEAFLTLGARMLGC